MCVRFFLYQKFIEDCPFVCVESDDDVIKNQFVLVMKDGRRFLFDEADYNPVSN